MKLISRYKKIKDSILKKMNLLRSNGKDAVSNNRSFLKKLRHCATIEDMKEPICEIFNLEANQVYMKKIKVRVSKFYIVSICEPSSTPVPTALEDDAIPDAPAVGDVILDNNNFALLSHL
nr:unnamed protein product [Callosobruchus chinensis]